MNARRWQAGVVRLAVRVGWMALCALGVVILLARASPESFSLAATWLVGLLVLVWLVTHLHLRRHGAPRSRRDLAQELEFELPRGDGPCRGRGSDRRVPGGWYRHRSHGGERPRFD